MSTTATPLEISHYSYLENYAREIADKIQDFEVCVLGSEVPNEVKLKILEWKSGYRSLAYFLHPQSEWTGGDSFKINLPHIADK